MIKKTKIWYIKNFNIFKHIPNSKLLELEKNMGMKSEKKKAILYFQDQSSDTIYLLKKGKIKISRLTNGGRITVLQLLGPGEIFGESAIFGRGYHNNVAEVLEDAVICTIDKEYFLKMMMTNPTFNFTITKYIGWRLRKVETHVEDLLFKDAQQRISEFLISYIQKFGKEMADGWYVRPFPSQQDIADLTAVSRQTASLLLNEMKEKKVIDFSRRFLKISDLKIL